MARIVRVGFEVRVEGSDGWHPQDPKHLLVGDSVAESIGNFFRMVQENPDPGQPKVLEARFTSVEPVIYVDWTDPLVAFQTCQDAGLVEPDAD
jgi:hypothetical protein